MKTQRLEPRNETAAKQVPQKEFILYLVSVFFFSNFNGMAEQYRQAYLVNELELHQNTVSWINGILRFVEFVLPFAYAIIIDRAPKAGKDKIRPLVKFSIIPIALVSFFLYWMPDMPEKNMAVFFLVTMAVFNLAFTFGDMVHRLPNVMTSDTGERDDILSIKSIASAIANSAPLVVILVLGYIFEDQDRTQWIVGSVLSGLCCCIGFVIGMKTVKERTVYSPKKVDPWQGFADVLHNKYALIIIFSDFLKEFRAIASYMGMFLAAVLLGSTSKFLFLGLPTAIGTMVGMLIVKQLLKRFNSKQIYMGSGVYAVFANTIAFLVGREYLRNQDNTFLLVAFIFFLFTIGLQYGASNLLPDMFKADILEDLELKTHKRLEASLYKIIGIGGTLSRLIAGVIAPQVLYGEGSFIGYVRPIDGVHQPQTLETSERLLLVYTIWHGLMMLAAGLPFFLYKLTGKTRDDIHEQLLAYRSTLENEEREYSLTAAAKEREKELEETI